MSRANVACAAARMPPAGVPAEREIRYSTCQRRQTIAFRKLWLSSPPLQALSKGRRQFLSAFCSPLNSDHTPASVRSKAIIEPQERSTRFSLRIGFVSLELLRGAGLSRHLAHHQRKSADRNLSFLNKHD